MTTRRDFLTRSGLALGALIVGDEMLEALDRLTHRKVFALGGVPRNTMSFVQAADIPEGGYAVEYMRVNLSPPGKWFFVDKRYWEARKRLFGGRYGA